MIGKVYVSRHFTPEAKARMLELVENLRAAYGSAIEELEWMSPDTKAAAQVKLAQVYPENRLSGPMGGLLDPRDIRRRPGRQYHARQPI